MPSNPSPITTSFSARRRWGIFFSVIISIVATVALVMMVNYLGARYFFRFPLSRQSEIHLSPQTLFALKSITNDVKVTILYDTVQSPIYHDVASWLQEYQLANPKVQVQTVDFRRAPGKAAEARAAYKLGTAEDKNLVIFDCNGRYKTVRENQLADFDMVSVPNENDKRPEFEEHLKTFKGEMKFTPALMSVVNRKPRKAYFLEGHGEHSIQTTGSSSDGYSKFAAVLEENGATNAVLTLRSTNGIPSDCNLLVIPGPQSKFSAEDLAKIRQYLNQGGRLMVLFNPNTWNFAIGLEQVLAEWNIAVGQNGIIDPENQLGDGGALVVTRWYNNHPISAALLNSRSTVNMVFPRWIGVLSDKTGPETPKVNPLATTGPKALVRGGANAPAPAGGPVSLMAAMEKGSVKGVFQERGTTAIVAVGDSIFLENAYIDAADNIDFVRSAADWLLDQNEQIKGIGPHPVTEYKVTMTRSEMNTVSWIFLAAMPGAILAFGGLVWFRRRH